MATDGQVLSYSHVLDFKEAEQGGFEIDKEETRIVRYIFGLFLKGENPNSIAKLLTDRGVPTPAGKKVWIYQTKKAS